MGWEWLCEDFTLQGHPTCTKTGLRGSLLPGWPQKSSTEPNPPWRTHRSLPSWWNSLGPSEFKPFTSFWHPENEEYITALSRLATATIPWPMDIPSLLVQMCGPPGQGRSPGNTKRKKRSKGVYERFSLWSLKKKKKKAFYSLALCSLQLMLFLLNNKRDIISLTFF